MSSCGCELTGLNTYSIVYTAFASSSSGDDFSLGTPLSSSKYIAFLNVLSTSGTPTAADFTGLWVMLYGSLEYVDSATASATTGSTITTVSKFVIPQNGWNANDTINLNYSIWTAVPAGTGQPVEVFCCGQSVVALDLSLFTADALSIQVCIKKTSTTTADFNFTAQYTDSTGAILGSNIYWGSISGMTNTASAASDIHLTARSTNGGQVLNRKFSSGQLSRA